MSRRCLSGQPLNRLDFHALDPSRPKATVRFTQPPAAAAAIRKRGLLFSIWLIVVPRCVVRLSVLAFTLFFERRRRSLRAYWHLVGTKCCITPSIAVLFVANMRTYEQRWLSPSEIMWHPNLCVFLHSLSWCPPTIIYGLVVALPWFYIRWSSTSTRHTKRLVSWLRLPKAYEAVYVTLRTQFLVRQFGFF